MRAAAQTGTVARRSLGFRQYNEGDSAKSAASMLSWVTAVHDDAIEVLAEDGWSALSGSVDWIRGAGCVVRLAS